MRQGNGSELLGANDPRSSSIGLIYISPNDDRKSVLAAILTQEKLGRKQVAVVLPNHNKAFQRPIDFNDLKSMNRRLQTQIIFIAPPGPGPAEFARQRRFTVYSSLESYTRSLLEEKDAIDEPKKGWFGAKAKSTNGGIGKSAHSEVADGEELLAGQRPELRREAGVEEDAGNNPPPVVPFMIGAASGAAGALAVDHFSHAPTNGHPANGGYNAAESDAQVVSPDYDDDGDSLAPSAPVAQNEPPAASNTGMIAPIDVDNAAGPAPIELPLARNSNRITNKLNPPPDEASLPPAQTASRNTKSRNGNTGKVAALGIGAAGLAAAAAQHTASSGGTPPTTRTGSGGGSQPPTRTGASGGPPPPVRPSTGGGGGRGPRRGGRAPWLLALALLLLVLVIIFGVLAYAEPAILGNASQILPFQQKSATVTITPASQTLEDSYVVTGLPNNPDPARLQVGSRHLVGTVQSQPKTVVASGHNQIAGAQATGTLTFTNGSGTSYTIGAGTSIQGANGVTVVTNAAAVVPPANQVNGQLGASSVSAHVAAVGANGNIRALTVSSYCCVTGSVVFVKNVSPFSGGQDPKNYHFVQQSDIDGVANPVKPALIQQAWSTLQKQVAPGDQLVSGAQCAVGVNSDHTAGDKGADVPQVTVSVAVKCTGDTYNRDQMLSLVKQQLQKKADSSFGPGYAPVGQVQTTTRVQHVNQGDISLIVNARGIWAFQLTDAVKQTLAKLIVGKSVASATTALQGQKGIANVKIEASGNSLPTDPTQIAINTQAVQGLPGNETPPPITPTVVSSTNVQGSSIPGNGSIETRALAFQLPH